MRVTFREINLVDINGRPYTSDCNYRLGSEFYVKATSAPRKTPLSLDKSIQFIWEMLHLLSVNNQHEEFAFILQRDDWVEILSQNGFHIELQPEDVCIDMEN